MGFRLGCAVWGFSGWVGPFLPEGTAPRDMLRLYARRFPTVEGNSVFYGIPTATTLQGWARQTPETFRFCPKFPRDISHGGLLAPRAGDALRLRDHLRENLGERLGPLFLQLPPSYGPDEGPDLAALLNEWRRAGNHPLLVEVRHPGWFAQPASDRLDTLLDRLEQGRVVLDTRPIYSGTDDPQAADPQADSERRKPNLPVSLRQPGSISLVRLICHPDLERDRASLAEWAGQVKDWLRSGREVYFFVHCPDESRSPELARLFHEALERIDAPVPPLPWDDLPPIPTQPSLF